jgi:hypothetical protein
MSAPREDEQMRALLAPLERIDPVTRASSRRSSRRLLLTLAVVVFGPVAAGAAIAAGLGAFSSTTTVSEASACSASTPALTTPSGAQVLTGHTATGVYCVAYKDTSGASGFTAAKFGETPVGQAVAMRVLDTTTNSYVIVGVVPPGYKTLAVGAATQIPIKNQAFVVDPKLVTSAAVVSGPSGSASVDLSELAATATAPTSAGG